MKILRADDKSFRKYGVLINNVDFTPVIDELSKVALPEGVVYEPSVAELEATPTFDEVKTVCYGESDIQIGYCIGHNTLLNALEYHRDSEINIFATDAILLLGKREDIEEDNTYDTDKVVAYYFEKGMAAEIYATTLHYAPCSAKKGEGFLVGVVLPKGTNYPLDKAHSDVSKGNSDEDALITAKNKWLIAHSDAAGEAGHFFGLKGVNIDIADDI